MLPIPSSIKDEKHGMLTRGLSISNILMKYPRSSIRPLESNKNRGTSHRRQSEKVDIEQEEKDVWPMLTVDKTLRPGSVRPSCNITKRQIQATNSTIRDIHPCLCCELCNPGYSLIL